MRSRFSHRTCTACRDYQPSPRGRVCAAATSPPRPADRGHQHGHWERRVLEPQARGSSASATKMISVGQHWGNRRSVDSRFRPWITNAETLMQQWFQRSSTALILRPFALRRRTANADHSVTSSSPSRSPNSWRSLTFSAASGRSKVRHQGCNPRVAYWPWAVALVRVPESPVPRARHLLSERYRQPLRFPAVERGWPLVPKFRTTSHLISSPIVTNVTTPCRPTSFAPAMPATTSLMIGDATSVSRTIGAPCPIRRDWRRGQRVRTHGTHPTRRLY